MNPITTALAEIRFRIPLPVLQVAFQDVQRYWQQSPQSLDEMILYRVIRPRVLLDCDLVGGTTELIPLEGIVPEIIDDYSAIFTIPPRLTQYRPILSALSVGYLPHATALSAVSQGFGYVSPQSMNSITNAAQRIGDAMSSMAPISNAYVELIGNNVILIRDPLRIQSMYSLRCIVANDAHLNNIKVRSYPAFAKLCELAIKSFIYNTLIIKIDQAYLQGGQELGAMKTTIETYIDAEDQYQTFLKEVWQKIAFMNDIHSHDRWIRLQVNPGL